MNKKDLIKITVSVVSNKDDINVEAPVYLTFEEFINGKHELLTDAIKGLQYHVKRKLNEGS
jgi:hypothetical protein